MLVVRSELCIQTRCFSQSFSGGAGPVLTVTQFAKFRENLRPKMSIWGVKYPFAIRKLGFIWKLWHWSLQKSWWEQLISSKVHTHFLMKGGPFWFFWSDNTYLREMNHFLLLHDWWGRKPRIGAESVQDVSKPPEWCHQEFTRLYHNEYGVREKVVHLGEGGA